MLIDAADRHIRFGLAGVLLLLLLWVLAVLRPMTVDAAVVTSALPSWRALGGQFDLPRGAAIRVRR